MDLSIKRMFRDWKSIEPGNWSQHAKILQYGKNKNDYVEIGLYREPMDGDEYEGTYTLQIFHGDDVIICETVEE